MSLLCEIRSLARSEQHRRCKLLRRELLETLLITSWCSVTRLIAADSCSSSICRNPDRSAGGGREESSAEAGVGGTGVDVTSEKTMMFINTDDITDVSQEGIDTEPLIHILGFVSTGCLLHSHAWGCDF